MFQSLRYSSFILRLGLAVVFFWFGIDKLFHPDYWLNAWVPQAILSLAGHIKITGTEIVYVSAVFEILVAVSLITNIFVSFFSSLAVLFLISISLFHGVNEVLIRDVGLMGAFISLILWPRSRNSSGFR